MLLYVRSFRIRKQNKKNVASSCATNDRVCTSDRDGNQPLPSPFSLVHTRNSMCNERMHAGFFWSRERAHTLHWLIHPVHNSNRI